MADPQQKPRLSRGWNSSSCRLTPAEGFLLSRIDGHTPWAQLRQIGGIPPEDVDRCLERWLAEGIVMIPAVERSPSNGTTSRATSDEPEFCGFESGTDLSEDEQRRIREFEGRLDRPYHEILSVDRSADTKAIKRAYFALSREFHPDRHFRRELGSFAQRLETIFMKVVEAYELLSDPTTRAEIERSTTPVSPPQTNPVSAADETTAAALNPPVNSKRATLERLRRHLRIPEKVMADRRFKAKQFHQSSINAVRRSDWNDAGASIRLAIVFDPWNDVYKRLFAEVQAQVHQVRAAELLEKADASIDAKAQQEAMRMFEEALSYRPSDPEINAKAAALAMDLGEYDSAREYAQTASELIPDNAEYLLLLGKVLRRMGLRDKAREALERSLVVDPGNRATKFEIKALKKRKSAR
jgi:curved DNA-binding protein CbpA